MSEDFNNYFGGMPTEPDVKRIVEAWPVETLVPGKEIKCSDIAVMLKLDVEGHRYSTVETAFRRRMSSNHNIEFRKQKGKLRVMSPDERIVYSGERQTSGVRIIRKAGRMAHRTDIREVSESLRPMAEHRVKLAAAIAAANRMKPKELKIPEEWRT